MNKQRWSIKYICLIGLLTALLVTISIVTMFVKIGDSAFQITTGLYLVFCYFVPGYGMLLCGIVYGAIMDLVLNSIITMWLTILINILMFLLMRYGSKIFTKHLAMIIASSLVFLYIQFLYYVVWNNQDISARNGLVIKEAIVDAIQWSISIIAFEVIYFTLTKTKLSEKLSNF
ncbi:hypothetical protein [Mesoplasma melaleucae]|uniref:Rod shape-determining protein MreD n=1 Tax=Mesoplasma melaleucae TaxID=81459 RepID=A0A2K8NW75_9MOLU|nr:hypothetical protein [Mesoplasma melaleucae]ATZ18092.1 hypothetical protein EMELA_v1c05580 [Mesoplasma melaleucae]